MQQIDVDFEVWKALTSKRESPEHSYNQVLREMLGLSDSGAASQIEIVPAKSRSGCKLGGRFLPDGTRLRAKYKGIEHHAEIKGGALIGAGGQAFPSASAAAQAITQTNVNGLLFWSVKRPGDVEWKKLVAFSKVP